MQNVVQYKNGNYTVTLDLNTGTKIRENDLDFFRADFPESFDCNITDKCDGGCAFCYQGCTPDGKHADIMNAKFLDTLHSYTEIAINGNDLSHPDLIDFLRKMKNNNIIVNMTVNQYHFMRHIEMIQAFVDTKVIHGLGISLTTVNDEFIEAVQKFPNAVIHVINGVIHPVQLEALKGKGLKILILGYKRLRRGEVMYEHQKDVIEQLKQMLYDKLSEIINEHWFDVVSCDNLAIEQLDMQRLMSKEQWDAIYMGDDGVKGALTSASMYVDLVKGEFAVNSCSSEKYPIMDSIDDMFQFLMKKYNED